MHSEITTPTQSLQALLSVIELPTQGGYFQGSSSAGLEGAWFGYRHVGNDIANCILLCGYTTANQEGLHIYWIRYYDSAWHVFNI